jgi:hypothetical protein
MAGRTKKGKILTRGILLSGAAALLLGCFLAWYFYVKGPPEAVLTDSELETARIEIERAAARMDEAVNRVRREVTGIREEVSKNVDALAPDGVARGLNDELDRFRRMEIRPDGVDDP